MLLQIADTDDQSDAEPAPAKSGGLRSLAALLPSARFFSGNDVRFHSIASSPEQCTPGQLVVYRIGVDCPDELISQALARGAAGILTEQILPAPMPQCIVSDIDRTIAELIASELVDENGLRADERLLTIGVVGESGKGTTAMCLATILRDIPCRVAYQTDLGQSDGCTTEVSRQSHATGARLLNELNDAADAGAAVAIIELDAVGLRTGGYDQIEFDVLVITGRNSGRNDFGPSAVDCAIERVRGDGVIVVASEDHHSISSVRETGFVHVTYGVNLDADVSLRMIGIEDGVLTAMIRHEMNSAIMESHLGCGVFAEALVAAAAVGVATDNPLVQITESLSKLRELPGRCQSITADDWNVATSSPRMVMDVAGSPRRMEHVLGAIRQQMSTRDCQTISMHAPTSSRATRQAKLWCVLAVSATDDAATLARYGRLLETMPDHCVLTCDRQSKDRFLSLSHNVLDGVEDCAAMRLVADQARAITWATQSAGPNDTVVVLGGVDRRSAHAQREDLERLKTLMTELQREVAGVAAQTGMDTQATKLKVFNPDGK
jgi:UDP-N-acetylmuramoyl-L-alanyl-D-glutamate--2,6-diaminopimelate ligase